MKHSELSLNVRRLVDAGSTASVKALTNSPSEAREACWRIIPVPTAKDIPLTVENLQSMFRAVGIKRVWGVSHVFLFHPTLTPHSLLPVPNKQY